MPATEYQVPTPLLPAVITPSRRSGFRPLPPCQPVVRFRFGLYGVVGGGSVGAASSTSSATIPVDRPVHHRAGPLGHLQEVELRRHLPPLQRHLHPPRHPRRPPRQRRESPRPHRHAPRLPRSRAGSTRRESPGFTSNREGSKARQSRSTIPSCR